MDGHHCYARKSATQQAIALGTRFIVAKSHSLITGFDCELGFVFMPVSVVER